MKKYRVILLIAVHSFVFFNLIASEDALRAALRAATYNITHANKDNWELRKTGVCDVIKKINADMYGFQEVITDKGQFATIKKTLPHHDYVGEPRSSGITGLSLWHRFVMLFATDEYCPIFYNKNKVKLISTETFGLNDTGYKSALLPRICTVGQFTENDKTQEFYVYNTHLDHKEESMRSAQIKIIMADVLQRCKNKPVILMGDFNTTFSGEMEKILTEHGFTLAKKVAKSVEGPDITHEKGSTKKLIACDFILIKPQDTFTIERYKTFDTMSKKTSDHNPVSMDFSLHK